MARRPMLRTVGAASAVVVAAVAGGLAIVDDGPGNRQRSRAAADRPCPRPYVEVVADELGGKLALQPVDGAEEPTALAVDPTGSAPVLLGERAGRVRVVDDDGDVTDEVALDLDDTSEEGDGGLLGLAYDPDGDWLYVFRTTAEQDDVVTAYALDARGRPDAATAVEVLRSDHPDSDQHHGGAFAFGPDGYLYVGFGDGGGHGDPRENAQDGGTLLGKLLRIDPTPGASEPYRVPDDNPFVGRAGWRPEVWASGVRNPYRLSFDPVTGDLWLGDVGQSCWEEIDVLTPDDAGANLGWDVFEGSVAFEGGDLGGDVVWPVHTYAHRDGWCALVVGPVLHHPDLPELDGWLLHTDYCRGRIMALRPATSGTDAVAAQLVDTGLRIGRPIAIVDGPDGYPWVLSLEGSIVRIVPGRR